VIFFAPRPSGHREKIFPFSFHRIWWYHTPLNVLCQVKNFPKRKNFFDNASPQFERAAGEADYAFNSQPVSGIIE
jgi:hypothetical protein